MRIHSGEMREMKLDASSLHLLRQFDEPPDIFRVCGLALKTEVAAKAIRVGAN